MICPPLNSIALSPESCNIAAQDSRCAEAGAAGHVEKRLVGAGAVQRIPPVLSSAAAVTLSDAESVVLPMLRKSGLLESRCWSASLPMVRLDPPSPRTKSRWIVPSLASEPDVDTAASLWIPKKAPAPIEARPVSALFAPAPCCPR